MTPRSLSILAGISYWIIFFAAIFANFMMLERLEHEPELLVGYEPGLVRVGILAFMVTVVFDVVVAWALYMLFKDHALSLPALLFRMMHAALMAAAIFALPFALKETTAEGILHQVDVFNTIWLIGLFFFGFHLLLLARILDRPRVIAVFLAIAGVMYAVDTAAHFLLPNYADHADMFLMLVAVPSILGEMAFAVWLLVRGGKAAEA